LTALYGIDHARTLSIVQPALLRETREVKGNKLVEMGRTDCGMRDPAPDDVTDRIEAMYRRLGMPVKLIEAGVDDPEAVGSIVLAFAVA